MKRLNISKILTIIFFIECLSSLVIVIYALFKPVLVTGQNVPMERICTPGTVLGAVLMFSLLLVLATLLLLFSVLVRPHQIACGRMLFVNLSLFILLSAVWLFLESPVPYLIIPAKVASWLGSYFSFYLMPIPLLFFTREICIHEKKVIDVLAALFILHYIIAFVYLVVIGLSIPPTLPILHGLIMISVATLVVINCMELYRYKNKEVTDLLIAITAFAIFSAAGIFQFYIQDQHGYIPIYMGGLLIFILILVIGTVRRMLVSLSKAKRFETIADSIPSGIIRVKNDERLTITYANAAYYHIYGLASEHEAKRTGMLYADKFMLEEQKNQFLQTCKRNIADGIAQFEVETREQDVNGREIWILNRMDYQSETNEFFCSMIDITDRKKLDEQLRIQGEEYRIAVAQSEKYILRYDIQTKTIYQQQAAAAVFGVTECIPNIPQNAIVKGFIAPESSAAYYEFFEAMQRGEAQGSAVIRMMDAMKGDYSWFHGDFKTIFGDDGQPQHGIVSFYDITELREKELAYERIRQDLLSVPPAEITAFDCNLTRDKIDSINGQLLPVADNNGDLTFNERTQHNIAFIHPADRKKYAALMNREHLLNDFEKGVSSHCFDYRRIITGKDYRWIQTTIQLVQYPDSGEVKAFVVARDIDEQKRASLMIIERSKNDALTGVLNRTAFQEQVENLLQDTELGEQHAFVMIDIDNFKQINDKLGHVVGDQVLITVTKNLKSMLREGDLIGRIGGDEFMICLKNIPYDDVIEKRAQLICQILSVLPDADVHISGSIGIAMYPRDGYTFEVLYQKADIAMYQAKERGRNQYVFYRADMYSEVHEIANSPIDQMQTDRWKNEECKEHAEILHESVRLQKLQEEAERYRLISDGMGMITFEWNIENGEFSKDAELDHYVLGTQDPAKIFLNQGDLSAVHPEDVAQMTDELFQPLEHGAKRAEVTVRLKRMDGCYDWCRLGAILVRDDEGNLLRAIGTIVVLKQAECTGQEE